MKKDKIFNGAEINKELFLLDGLEYYSVDPEKRRCKAREYNCTYSSTKTSIGCFIGKHLSDEQSKEYDTFNIGIGDLMNKTLRLELPEWVNNSTVGFLGICQNFHDFNSNWNENGLSAKGKDELKGILDTFNIPKQNFQKYLQ